MKNLIILFSLFLHTALFAQISITTGNVISIDFNSYDASGFAPTPAAGELDSDEWAVIGLSDGDLNFGETQNTGDFARGIDPDGVTTGGIYAFEVSASDFSLGVQPGGTDFTPGTFTLRLLNNTGAALTELNIQYDIYVYNDQGRGNSFNFSYSDDNATYNSVGSLDYTSVDAADGSPAWVSNLRTTTISGLNIANTDTLWLRWTGDDVSGAALAGPEAGDELAVARAAVHDARGSCVATDLIAVGR